jgi:DNA-binding transcriptional LysR family regulator
VERFGYARQLADLQDLPYVGSDWLRTHEAGGERFFARHGLQPKEVMHTNSCSAQVNAVAAGLGWAVMSHRWARNHSNIVRLVPSMNVVETELWLSARRGFARIARVKALYDFLLCSFEEDRELFVADDEDARSER